MNKRFDPNKFEECIHSIYHMVERCEAMLESLVNKERPTKISYPPYSEEFRNRELWNTIDHYKLLRALHDIGMKYVKDVVDGPDSILTIAKNVGPYRLKEIKKAIQKKWEECCREEKQKELF